MANTPQRKTAEEILAVNDTRTDDMFIEEWDTNVKVVGLTKQQQLDIKRRATVDGEVDEDKSQMFLWQEGVAEPKFTEDQVALLFQKNAGPVDRILKRVLELSGMKEEDVAKRQAEFRKK
jgi:hypothetical protein